MAAVGTDEARRLQQCATIAFGGIVCWTLMTDEDDANNDEQLLVSHRRQVRRQVIVKVDGYMERVVAAMTNETFKTHFRLSLPTFEILLEGLGPLLRDDTDTCRPTLIGPRKQLMVCLWLLGNPISFRELGDRFGMSRSTAHGVVLKVVDALLTLNNSKKLIAWPDELRSKEIQRSFLQSYHFPGVVGCIDGSHIPIKAPSTMPVSYVNRKGIHSILLQGVCDNKLLFTDCYAGEVGSIHDSCMLRRSDLYERMETTPLMFLDNSHMLGDLAYPLKQHLIVAYKNNGHLTRKQEKFNRTLSAARSCIERAFALLKGRWRRLKYLDMSNIEQIPRVIIACCILHNVCILNDDLIDLIDVDPQYDCEEQDEFTVQQATANDDRREGIRKREDIVNSL